MGDGTAGEQRHGSCCIGVDDSWQVVDRAASAREERQAEKTRPEPCDVVIPPPKKKTWDVATGPS
jgi:hypothetical protein